MKNLFWNELLNKGAFLGLFGLAISIIQLIVSINHGITGYGISFVVSLVGFICYIYLAYRFTKGYSLKVMEQQKEPKMFSFSLGWSFVVVLVILAEVIENVGEYLFQHFVIGYDKSVESIVSVLNQIKDYVDDPATLSMVKEVSRVLYSTAEPSIIDVVISSISAGLLLGGILGLIIAAFTKHTPQIFDKENEQ